jgi:hypothetical protein
VKYTPNLNLKKPAKTDPVLIDDLNDNMDILDQEVQGVRDTINQKVQDIRDTIDQEVQDLQGIIDNTVQALDAHAETRAALNKLGHVNHVVLTTTIDTTWQGSQAPYTKTQTVNGLLATDTPIVDVVMSGDFGIDEARIEAWGYVYRITTANNAITLYATEKPAVELPIQLKVVR